MTLGAALPTGLGRDIFFISLSQLGRDDSGRHGNDSVADNHYYGGNSLPERGLGRYITIADGGQGNNGPVNAARNAGKSVLRILNQIHQGPKYHHQGQIGRASCRERV